MNKLGKLGNILILIVTFPLSQIAMDSIKTGNVFLIILGIIIGIGCGLAFLVNFIDLISNE